jgi:hypothetical protein
MRTPGHLAFRSRLRLGGWGCETSRRPVKDTPFEMRATPKIPGLNAGCVAHPPAAARAAVNDFAMPWMHDWPADGFDNEQANR